MGWEGGWARGEGMGGGGLTREEEGGCWGKQRGGGWVRGEGDWMEREGRGLGGEKGRGFSRVR